MSFTIFQNDKSSYQAIKTRSLKSRKIDIFPKGLTHDFGPKMPIFPSFSFQGIQARKMSFTIFQNKKTPFQIIKRRISKRRKIHIFPKVSNPWFWSKNGHFCNFFFFRKFRPGKCLLLYSRTKKRLSRLLKKKSLRSGKIDIFPKGLTNAFGPKMADFPPFFFFKGIQARKMSFTICQNEKTSYQTIKTRKLKSRKIDIFPKGLTHDFGPKQAHICKFFFQPREARKMSFTIFQNEETPFQIIKKTSSKRRKIDIFPKGLTNGIGPKMAIFPTVFFLGNLGQENVFQYILERKDAFLDYKKKKFKRAKN